MADGNVPAVSRVLDNTYRNAVYNWLSPEVLDGQMPTDRSDLYSYCVIIWEILHGIQLLNRLSLLVDLACVFMCVCDSFRVYLTADIHEIYNNNTRLIERRGGVASEVLESFKGTRYKDGRR